MGALAALRVAETGPLTGQAQHHFRAVVAYYPPCRPVTAPLTIPALILIGSADDSAPATQCQALVKRQAGHGAPVTLHVFPGATHAFDSPAPPHFYLGHQLRFDPNATFIARREAGAFLHHWLDQP